MFNNLLKMGMFSIALVSGASNADVLNTKEQKQLIALKEKALASNLSYDLIESLTTEVGHRLVGSEGDKKSIVWAVFWPR